MGTGVGLNFLRFLTAHLSVNPYNNGILLPLFSRITKSRVDRSLRSFTRAWKDADGKKEAGLYIHIPYCVDQCTFCHCARCQLEKASDLDRYVTFLIDQARSWGKMCEGVRFSSVYFGGGTPSILATSQLQSILKELDRSVHPRSEAQITFEAHPASLSEEKVSLLTSYGVNRISLGAQSLDDVVLARIGRRQDRDMVIRRIRMLKKYKVPVINVDLVAGLPGQTVKSFLDDLRTLMDLGVDVIHLNPFSNLSELAGSSRVKHDIAAVIRLRTSMVVSAKKLLRDAGFGKEGMESFRQGVSQDVYHESSFLERAGSVVGLGVHGMTNLTDEYVFRLLPGRIDMTKGHYTGFKPPERYAMANYMIFHLLRGLDADEFKSIFNKDPYRVFAAELKYLERCGVIVLRKNGLIFEGGASLSKWMDFFAHTKIFYGQELLTQLKERFDGQYKDNIDYSSGKFLLMFFQDIWVASLYHDIGL